jgi:CRISPR-associated protein Cas2
MLVLVTYDVSTVDRAGQRRLHKVAKKCLDFGQRVQKSVFECSITTEQYVHLKNQLAELIDPQTDSLRIYQIGDRWKDRVEHIGAKPSFDVNEPLII